MLYVTVSNVACLLGYQSPYILIQFGWIVSWYYLRFIKFNASEGESIGTGGMRGDRSETFAFAIWFPPFLQCVSCTIAEAAPANPQVLPLGNMSECGLRSFST